MTVFDKYITAKNYSQDDEGLMRQALFAGEGAKARGDQPVGAVLSMAGKYSMASKYLVEHDTVADEGPLHTAVLNILHKAFDLMPRYIANSTLYCTVEPTALDVLAATACGINEIVFGCYNIRDGFASSPQSSLDLSKADISWRGGVLAEECRAILAEEVRDYYVVENPNQA
jgi:tRNA(Arg) A34 adenosine deaminase TadA